MSDAGLGHAVAFGEVEAHLAIPPDDVDGDGGTAGTYEARVAEAEVGQDLLADDVANDGDGEKEVESLLGDFLEDALLKTDVRGVAGNYSFNENRDLKNSPITIYTFKNSTMMAVADDGK